MGNSMAGRSVTVSVTVSFCSKYIASLYSVIFLLSVLHLVSHCLQPADRWGMKLVETPCGNSVWVTEGEAEKAVETKGMDAVNAARWCSKVVTL